MLQIEDRFGQGLACKAVGGGPWHLRRHNQSPTGALVAASRRPAGIPPGPDAAASPLDIPEGWDPRTNQQPTGLLIALPAQWTFQTVSTTTKTLIFRMKRFGM